LSIITNRLKPLNKRIVGFYRRLDRNIVGRSEANALATLTAPAPRHGRGVGPLPDPESKKENKNKDLEKEIDILSAMIF